MVVATKNAYLRYDELTAVLQDYARQHPERIRLQSLGRSHEGRDIWLTTLTRFATGNAEDKPALWLDANIHSAELVSGAAALYLIQYLLERDGHDPDVSRCLDEHTFYICPRVNPDGVEWALADTPRLIRSSTRPWPTEALPVEGLVCEDMDGDGRILTMRIPDSNGPWKISANEPRLLVRRDPAETGGRYYRLLPEGRLLNPDGITLPAPARRENLDLNRNFPGGWLGEHQQPGAGPYPASEPEVRAIVDFIARHPNICSGIALHSYSGVLLRPFSHKPDDAMPAEDRWVFEAIGRKGSALTGYPAVSAYHGFRYHPQKIITGAMDDWLYEEQGRLAWTVELWNPLKQAGIDNDNFMDWYREHPLDDDIKLLAWSDKALGGAGYIDWYPYDHPQLGSIELGGWDALYSLWNPPPALLQQEVAALAPWLVWHNLLSPRLKLLRLDTRPLAEQLWQVSAVVQNTGWLPTDVTRLARDRKMLPGVTLEIETGAAAELISGPSRRDAGQLEGFAHKAASPNVWGGSPADPTDERVIIEWIVRGDKGAAITVVARHDRAGKISTTTVLGASESH